MGSEEQLRELVEWMNEKYGGIDPFIEVAYEERRQKHLKLLEARKEKLENTISSLVEKIKSRYQTRKYDQIISFFIRNVIKHINIHNSAVAISSYLTLDDKVALGFSKEHIVFLRQLHVKINSDEK